MTENLFARNSLKCLFGGVGYGLIELIWIYAPEHGRHGRSLLCNDLLRQRKALTSTAVAEERGLRGRRDAHGILRGNAGQPRLEYGRMGLFG